MKKIFYVLGIMIFLASCKKESVFVEYSDPIAKEKIIELKTQFGDMYIWLYKATPLHRDNFLKLASEAYYDNTTFHRVISGFMGQGGDPNSKDADPSNDGTGGPGYTVPAEIMSSINHERGALGAARNNNPEKASNGSQFYICHSTSGTSGLDGNISPLTLSSYWIYGYLNGNDGSSWSQKLESGTFNPGEGYLLKSPGAAQNYTFKGVPNDGDISFVIDADKTNYINYFTIIHCAFNGNFAR